jgi:Lar family restriction alleviation protein
MTIDTDELRRLHGAGTKLLPCPFCDAKPQPVPQNGFRQLPKGDWTKHIWCENCGAQSGEKDMAEDAIAAWNRRANPAADKLARWQAVLASDDAVERVALAILNSDRAMRGHPPVPSREVIVDSDGYVTNARAAIAALVALMGEG